MAASVTGTPSSMRVLKRERDPFAGVLKFERHGDHCVILKFFVLSVLLPNRKTGQIIAAQQFHYSLFIIYSLYNYR